MELQNIPDNIQTDFLTQTLSNVMPSILRLNTVLFYPAFIRKLTRHDDMTQLSLSYYIYFRILIPYKGQDYTNLQRCKYQCYSLLRKYFYGPWSVQMLQQLKGTFAAHQYAVKCAFPKFPGLSLQLVNRFRVIKQTFWGAIDSALALLGKTRADLPPMPFNALLMIQWAYQQGMSLLRILYYSGIFTLVSLNLLQNGRNWNLLFN